MRNMKKAVVFILAILIILTSVRFSFAAQILTDDTGSSNDVSSLNTSADDTNEASPINSLEDNTIENLTSNEANVVEGVEDNSTLLNSAENVMENETVENTYFAGTENDATVNSTNAAEDLPSTGIEDTYLNFALILLLALVLGMFSLIQYRRIIKNEDQ